MSKSLLHTPEGVRDIFGSECAAKATVTEKIMKRMKLNGFELIETPGFEYFDIFRKERGTVDSKLMYRFFDRDGETLVLRPDVTPAIARCVAKYYKTEKDPLRFCYRSNIYRNNLSYQGKLRENTEIGIELINENSVYADAEVLACSILSLIDAGLKEFQLEIGNAAFFESLVNGIDLDPDELFELRGFIEDKYGYGVDTFLSKYDSIPSEKKEMLHKLTDAFGSIEQLKSMPAIQDAIKDPCVASAFNRLCELDEVLSVYGLSDYVTYDLSMLGKLGYYTGIIFRGYTYGTGEAVLSGGRYDNLVGQFGENAAAVGMSVNIDSLMMAVSRQKIEVPYKKDKVLILCCPDKELIGYKKANDYRNNDIVAVLEVTSEKWTEERIERYKTEFGFTKVEALYE